MGAGTLTAHERLRSVAPWGTLSASMVLAHPGRRLTSAWTWRGPLSEKACVCAPTSSYRRVGRLRPPALAPQLKRDPLGRY